MTNIMTAVKSADSVIMASGSLAQLDLMSSAVRTYDAGRMCFFLKEYDNISLVMKNVGPIGINLSLRSTADEVGPPFQRMNKDAEVHALCLIAYWVQSEAVTKACADLAFEFQQGGVGSKAKTGSLKLIDDDDKKRKVQGLCGWRRCLFYGDILNGIISEDRFAGHIKEKY